MKPHPAPTTYLPRFVIRWTASLLLGAVVFSSGCVTRQDVAEIVTQSNAALIAGQLGGLPQKDGEKPVQTWQESNERIEAFIEAHPDQKTSTAPLRIRQAMLLLANKQFSLAQAAFDSVAPGDLHSDRDQALKRNVDSLVWWFSRSTSDTWSAEDQHKATKALEALAKEQESLGKSPEIRDYLAEMRAWIGLAAAKQTTNEAEARARLVNALDVYARIFSAQDLTIVEAGAEQLLDLKALTSDVRRRLRAKPVLTAAQKQNQTDRLAAHPANPTFDRMINR